MFCLLDLLFGGPDGQFRRNGGVCSVTTMCYLLFVPDKKRYLFVYYFRIDSVVLTVIVLLRPH
jgi:hypothetical protein